MLSVAEAQAIVLEHTKPLLGVALQPVMNCLNQVLACDIVSDIDSPPFDKAMVDGYAVRCIDVVGDTTLLVTQEILAGQPASQSVGPGEAASIMTGAPLPTGADAVVMHEVTKRDGDRVTLRGPLKPSQNIMARAAEMKQGDIILRQGTRLQTADLGLLASTGYSVASVYGKPRVAILSTGDELVEPGEPLGPGQIRNSNASLLAGQVVQSLGVARYQGIARDSVESLTPLIKRGLLQDVLLITGGVSAGKVDLVPDVLQACGVKTHFHKVALKPGKPLLFGTYGNTLIFGLPGNPVSGLVNFLLFVKPALLKLRGCPEPYVPGVLKVKLTQAFTHRSDRPTYYPVRLELVEGEYLATPLAWKGSGDLRTLSAATTLLVLPAGELSYPAGEWVHVLVNERS
jgi:molybdopterin molybdotransferase